jgi:hypothetical protein
MSAKTIAAFKAFAQTRGTAALVAPSPVDVTGCAPKHSVPSRNSKREARTEPPPASMAVDFEAQAAELESAAMAMLSDAKNLRSAARSARRIEKLSRK